MTKEHIVTDNYAGPERRKYVKTLEQLEADITKMFSDHEVREKQWIKEVKDEILKAFPDEDVEKHCDYHESKARAARAEEAFWETAKSEALKHGISGVFSIGKWIAILAVLGLAFKFGVGPAVAKFLGVTING